MGKMNCDYYEKFEISLLDDIYRKFKGKLFFRSNYVFNLFWMLGVKLPLRSKILAITPRRLLKMIASEMLPKSSEARREAYISGSQKIGRGIIKIFGCVLKIDLTEMEAYLLLTFYNQIFIKDQYCANRFIKSGDVVLDCGANCGLFALLASKLVGNRGKVFAFEPV
ncbi:hypothetical protein KAR91_79475 [Candidatus Pacearchaeota archaeon]|nr:hypothetical protein [Candidatus Pacearchaeota archaeon]